jgi:hypothetical protein
MTRKDYIKIARAIEDAVVGNAEKWEIVHELCKAFKLDNSAFNRDKFMEACGVTDK